MKKMPRMFCFSLTLILISGTLFAQQKQNKEFVFHFPMWTVGIDGGEIVPFGTFGNLYNSSISAGLEISYHPSHRFAFFFNPQYNFLSVKDENFGGIAGYTELSIGSRAYFGKKPEIFFIEAGAGDYIYYLSSNDFVDNSLSNTSNYFGIKAGLGGNMPLSAKILLFIKTDFHFIFSSSKKTEYLGLYCGLKFMI
jgi:hypothetical protein